MKLAIAVILLVAFSGPAVCQTCPPDTVPALDPQADETSSPESDFLKKGCPPFIFERFFPDDLHRTKVAFSHSAKWGDLVRVDTGEPDKARYERFVCFRNPKDTKVVFARYDLKTGACFWANSGKGYWTIYPPLSGQH